MMVGQPQYKYSYIEREEQETVRELCSEQDQNPGNIHSSSSVPSIWGTLKWNVGLQELGQPCLSEFASCSLNDLFFSFLLYLLTYILCACMHICALAHLQRSEDSFRVLILFFHHADPREWTQIARLGGRCFCWLRCLAGPKWPVLSGWFFLLHIASLSRQTLSTTDTLGISITVQIHVLYTRFTLFFHGLLVRPWTLPQTAFPALSLESWWKLP